MRAARLPRLGVHYPRSFLKLIIVGFILVALPLILAIGNNAVSINEIADHSQRTVREAMKATEASRLLSEQLTAMERSVRQAAALEDAALLDGYHHARTRFLEGAERVAALRLGEPQRRQLSDLRRRESALSAAVDSSGAAPEILIGLLDEFEDLEHSATALADLGNTVVEQEVEALQSMAAGVQRFVFWQLAALVPVALVLVVGAIILISRPISQIDAAIRRMGEGDFDERVEVSGPQDLQHLGRQLDWMRLRLIELREEKQRFLHHMSHELKTPLAAIKEGTGLLHEQLIGPLSNAQKEVTGILAQNTQRMQELIEGLLQYHETQFQRAALTPVPVPLHPLVVATLKQHSLSIVAKGVRLVVECPPLTIEADRDKLAAILGNLISNAVKFSPRGGSLRVVVATDLDDTVRIDVQDEGPGIPEAEREKVFEPFFQGRTPHDSSVKGTGLGLAIVREFVLAHRGDIEIVPSDRGTHIVVGLPRTQPWAAGPTDTDVPPRDRRAA
jgi:two-component system sensor histidine kinase GlrK